MHIVTEGDRSSAAIAQLGGTGVFVAAIRRALLEGSVDLAVHSYKDLPTAPEPGLSIAAVPRARTPATPSSPATGSRSASCRPARRSARAPRAASRSCARSASGSTSSRSAATWTPGWAGSREGDLDAVVLARAGLARLGRLDAITETLDPLQVLPAPAQGALAVECRTSDARTRELLGRLENATVRACVVAERSTLAALEAGCSAPVAAYAEVAEGESGPELFLRASVTAIDGSDAVRGSITGPPAGGRRARARPGHGTPRPRRGRTHGGRQMTARPPDPRRQALRARIRSTR